MSYFTRLKQEINRDGSRIITSPLTWWLLLAGTTIYAFVSHSCVAAIEATVCAGVYAILLAIKERS